MIEPDLDQSRENCPLTPAAALVAVSQNKILFDVSQSIPRSATPAANRNSKFLALDILAYPSVAVKDHFCGSTLGMMCVGGAVSVLTGKEYVSFSMPRLRWQSFPNRRQAFFKYISST